MSKFKVGDRVKIPKTKSTHSCYNESGVIARALKENLEFLYVTLINEDKNVKCDTVENNGFGDFFLESDLELYEEPKSNIAYVFENKGQETSSWDRQISGNHYKGKIQPFEMSMKNGHNALQHAIIKYVDRYKDKNGIEDLEKAKHCLEMLIEWETKNAQNVVS